MKKVYIVRCPDYDQVEEKIEELLSMMEGIEQFVTPDERIVLKPNLLTAAIPEKAATTHPSVVAAVAKKTRQAGGSTCLADSPGSGYPYNEKTMKRVYRTCGMTQAAEESGIELNFDTRYEQVSFPEGTLIKHFEVITPVLRADGVINICKLKTHGFLSMTGAVKNSFGVIPGLTKPGYHAKLQDKARFAGMCLDLSQYVAPRLSVMDAVIGMEGNGPHHGTPRQVGFLLASDDPLALDVVASEIMGLERQYNPILLEAEKRGLTPNRLEEIDLVGMDIQELRIADFVLPSTLGSNSVAAVFKILGPLFKKGFTVRPHILADKCVGCGACRDSCPVHVITIEDKRAVINARECIRCYCCHEMCPYDAIDLRGGLLYRLFNRG